MSVFKADRSKSPIEYYHTATLARNEITRLVMNEKLVPRQWRPVFTYPTIEKAVSLIDAITAADTIEPHSDDDYILKLKWSTRAIIVVEQILQQLQYLIETLRPNVNKFKRVTELLMEDLTLLKQWKSITEEHYKSFNIQMDEK